MKVCFPVARFGREVLKVIGCATLLAVRVHAFAESPEDKIPFAQTRFPNIQVRHVPAPANDAVRKMPKPGAPRTRLPILNAPGPKGGKLIHPDNSYLIPCPVPPLAVTSTNSTATAPANAVEKK